MDARFQFILYVKDQKISRDFYSLLLGQEPSLDVIGMTEFQLGNGHKLGLMPAAGIKKLLKDKIQTAENNNFTSKCELYIMTPSANDFCKRAVAAGAVELSGMKKRNWGDSVAYYSDPDGHVIAIAQS